MGDGMILVKLGGSAITHKEREKSLDAPALKRLARELSTYKGMMIVVHGAGSFGHMKAKKYGLDRGARGPKGALHAAEVQADVRELNLKVIDALRCAGIPALSAPPALFMDQTAGKDVAACLDAFHDMLRGGYVPVTFGDVVLDKKWGASICSGDILMEILSDEFRPDAAVFVTNVDGVFDRDPKLGKASLIRRIHVSTAPKVKGAKSGSDVTGAMAAKLRSALEIARPGTRVIVLNGLKSGRLELALKGKRGKWTEIGD
ncbi:MAG: isopentenyl phosphate kinase family protein [Euryarchaeota archaeon]|nr:isopentenyl phosphate kinase family protein [Euryarchaeota archaeon]